MGGTEDLWSATQNNPANFGIMGVFSPGMDFNPNNPFLFGVDMPSSAVTNGAFAGYLGGVIYNVTPAALNNGISDIMGTSYALYIDPELVSSYQAGVLHGPFKGDVLWATYLGENGDPIFD
jgi:hypothetical protein